MTWFFLSSYVLIIRLFINLMSSMFITSHIFCAIDSSTKTYFVTSIFIIVIKKCFFIKQFINIEFSSNKSFFIKKNWYNQLIRLRRVFDEDYSFFEFFVFFTFISAIFDFLSFEQSLLRWSDSSQLKHLFFS